MYFPEKRANYKSYPSEISPKPTFELRFGYFIFSGISGLVAHAARRNSQSEKGSSLPSLKTLSWKGKNLGHSG